LAASILILAVVDFPPVVAAPAEPVSRMKRIYFHRDYRGFTGGHLKVWDYF
jgi:hypothetical protein